MSSKTPLQITGTLTGPPPRVKTLLMVDSIRIQQEMEIARLKKENARLREERESLLGWFRGNFSGPR